ncbi:MAG: ribokinase [archaeon]|nr:ribokinase [archaeon]
MKDYEFFIFGNISVDIIKTPKEEYSMIGGAILHSSWTAHQLGRSLGVLTKTTLNDKKFIQEFPEDEIDIFWKESKSTTSIKNDYRTKSKETRICTCLKKSDPFKIGDFPKMKSDIIQFCGLMAGEIDLKLIKFLSNISSKTKIALDAQGLIRKVHEDNTMKFSKWYDKLEALPYVNYFKMDAAEANFLTGINTIEKKGIIAAGKKILNWGPEEILISHKEGLFSITKNGIYSASFKNKDLSGRTGRGDTSFTAYISERIDKDPQLSIEFAAALASLKMEIPGPFKLKRIDVEKFMHSNY